MVRGFLNKVEDNAAVRIWSEMTQQEKVLVHPDTEKRVEVFTFSIYSLVIFPRALGHVDEAVTDLFDRLDKGVTPVPAILTETFRSLNAYQKAGEGRFIGCAQLLLAWLYSHFWKVDKVSYRVFSENYSQLKEVVATLRRDDILMEKWMAILQNLQEEEIEWRAPWLLSDEILYRCGDFDWVPLLGIWGAVKDGYKKKIQEMTNAWKQTRRMKRLVEGPMTTPEYIEWWVRKINDNIPEPSYESSQLIEEYLQWHEEIQEEKNKADKWERRFQEVQVQNEALKKSLSENQKENGELENRVTELEGSLHRHRNQNSIMELRARLNRIEEMKERIKELEIALQNCEIRIENLEVNKDRQNEKLHYFQNQVRDRYHIMGEVVVQIREVANHLQTLAVQADVLSVKYELE
ncbi:hypothetical protein Goshw_000299 [Gossypium schwendimanii]|uniref:DUF7745 domain-containing protein n=1 Tax=Gossypium schwendimanii TaxID=34291 RepID=A0A7J9N461_GOSSC|nr:hypothetical protein [Gossypium schwendimanii]